MMPAGHHSDSGSTLLPLPKLAITWFGGIFARLPPLAAGLVDWLSPKILKETVEQISKPRTGLTCHCRRELYP